MNKQSQYVNFFSLIDAGQFYARNDADAKFTPFFSGHGDSGGSIMIRQSDGRQAGAGGLVYDLRWGERAV